MSVLSFQKTFNMEYNNVKEIMYSVLHVKAMYIMDIDFFRLAFLLNKCLENYAMHTE